LLQPPGSLKPRSRALDVQPDGELPSGPEFAGGLRESYNIPLEMAPKAIRRSRTNLK
jgi:hypothetical protein